MFLVLFHPRDWNKVSFYLRANVHPLLIYPSPILIYSSNTKYFHQETIDCLSEKQSDLISCLDDLALIHHLWTNKHVACNHGRPAGLVAVSQAWRFSGLGSYLRIARSDTTFFYGVERSFEIFSFQFSTLQDNSLILLIGNNTVSDFVISYVAAHLGSTFVLAADGWWWRKHFCAVVPGALFESTAADWRPFNCNHSFRFFAKHSW